MSFSIAIESWFGEQVCVLRGPAGNRAVIWPEMGANLIELELSPAPGREAVPVISSPADADTLRGAPTRYGAPVLFPFPSRIADGRFSYEGKEYQLDVYPDDGNARHGFVLRGAFSVDGLGADAEGSWVTLSFDGNIPDVQSQFPFPFRLSMTFRLDAEGLIVEVLGTNTGTGSMPLGFGWHPYFHMPLVPGGNRATCRLKVPARQYWELNERLVPTGRQLPVAGKLDMLRGCVVGEHGYDDMLTAVVRDEKGWSHAALLDDSADLSLVVSAGPTFREWVIYTPPNRPAVCLEPYTCPGNAFNMHSAGGDVGVQIVAAGESWQDAMRVQLGLLQEG